jgi:sugar lactone lactonase YvrE
MALTLRDLVPEQEPEVLGADFQFTEGPVWHPDGYLLFSDIPANTIYRHAPGRKPEPYITPSHNSNGLTFDASGRLLACENVRRQVSRMGHNGQMSTLVSHSNGKRLNSPNDIVVHSSSSIFFTDPPYGIDPDPGEQGFNGVYRYDPDDGSIIVLRTDMDRPNGLAFSPDESVLYVDDSRNRHVLAFPVNSDLTLGVPYLLINMDVPEPGNPDGMKVDSEGDIYVTGGGGLWVLDPAGRHLGTVPFPQATANLAFGGPDYQTIYVTARAGLYSIRVNVPGRPVF